jgi:hypothetical protein
MKKNKKQQPTVPMVHVMGDLQDVKKLVRLVNKKKTLVIFRNGEDATLYAEVEDEMMQFAQADITRLQKIYRIIYFDFFPGGKKGAEIQIKGEIDEKIPSQEDKSVVNEKAEKKKEIKEKKKKSKRK